VQTSTSKGTRQAIKYQALGHHATSTCAIGAENDVMACLDSKIQVRGPRLESSRCECVSESAWKFPTVPIYIVRRNAAKVFLEEVLGKDLVLL